MTCWFLRTGLKNNKTYTDDEKPRRFIIFQQTLRKIEKNNSSLPIPPFWMGLTPFSAMTDEELRSEFFIPESYFSSSDDDDDEELERRANLCKFYDDKKHDTKEDVTPPPPVTVKRQTRGGDEKQDTKRMLHCLWSRNPKNQKTKNHFPKSFLLEGATLLQQLFVMLSSAVLFFILVCLC
ncbi:uncharacterized protein LOC143599225 [Bidens hawaiensis]|uniref:uncharacterized protein LOC143599225 n=1 Tax=Bidens hawaiensis TaxID=980011 RepID=UPI00404AB4B9